MTPVLIFTLLATAAWAIPAPQLNGYNEIYSKNTIDTSRNPVTMSESFIKSGGANYAPAAHLSNTNIQLTAGSPSIVKTGDTSMALSNAASMDTGTGMSTSNVMLHEVPVVPVVRETYPAVHFVRVPSSLSSSLLSSSSSSSESSYKKSSEEKKGYAYSSSAGLPVTYGLGYSSLVLNPVRVYAVPSTGVEFVKTEGISGLDFGKGSLSGIGFVRKEGVTGLDFGTGGVSALSYGGVREGASTNFGGVKYVDYSGLGYGKGGASAVATAIAH